MNIEFEIPEGRKNEGQYCYDMHFHTEYSMDGISHIPYVVRKARKLDIGLAITDHNTISGSLKAKGMGATVIPGIEVTGHEGPHMLYYFYSFRELKDFWHKELEKSFDKNPFFSDRPTFDIIDAAKDYNCLISAAHPFGPGITGIMKMDVPEEVIRKIDAVEVLNGYNLHSLNEKAIEWAKGIKKAFTGGTDGHTTYELGGTVTISGGADVEEHLDCIRKKKTSIVGKEEDIFRKAILAAMKEEQYIMHAHEEHKALLLIESQFSTEYHYMMDRIREDLHRFKHLFSSHHN